MCTYTYIYIYTYCTYKCIKSYSIAAKEECGCIPFGCMMSLLADIVRPFKLMIGGESQEKASRTKGWGHAKLLFLQKQLDTVCWIGSNHIKSDIHFQNRLAFPCCRWFASSSPLSQGGTSQTRSKHWPLALRTSARQRWKTEPYWSTLAGAKVSMFAASSFLL